MNRDLEPDNILISAEVQIKTVDFGLAKQVLRAAAGDAPPRPWPP